MKSRFIYGLICVSLFILTQNKIKAQSLESHQYWFVAPDASNRHSNSDRPTFFMIVTDNRAAEIKISMPANSGFTPVTETIEPNSYHQHIFSTNAEIDLVENSINSSAIVTSKGFLIESSVPVSVYYQIDGPNQKEIFTLKGDRALGQEFYIPMQNKYSNNTNQSSYSDGYRQIQIVATENNTAVNFKGTGLIANNNGGVIPSGVQDSRILNKGQTLLLRGQQLTTNLGGSHITSDKPIAITVFEDCISTGSGVDPIGDQIVPVNQLGKNYIIVKGYSTSPVVDLVTLVAASDNTSYTLKSADDNTIFNSDTLDKGESITIDIGSSSDSPAAYILQASEPIYCLHVSAGGGEIGGAIIPSLYSIAARRIGFMKGALDRNSLFLIFRESAKDGFTIDDQPLSINPVSLNFDGWMYAKHDLLKATEGYDYTSIKNSDGPFSMGYFLGNSGTSLYGYFSDFGTFSFGANDTIYHCGQSYNFEGGYALGYKWTLPDGTINNNASLIATKSGKYKVEVNQDPYLITDSIYLKLQNFSHKLSLPKGTAIIGQEYDLAVVLNPENDPDNYYEALFEWDLGDGASSNTVNTALLNNVSWNSEGVKEISLKITNKDAVCDTTVVAKIHVVSPPDNIIDADCTIDPDVTNWEPAIKGISQSQVHILAQLFVGDIDGDGESEIITTNAIRDPAISYILSDSILIFDRDLKLKKAFETPRIRTNSAQPIALVRLSANDKDALIITVSTDHNGYNYKLLAYKPDGTLFWESDETVIDFNLGIDARVIASICIAVGDINNDGIPEILAGDRIFNAKTGKMIVSLPEGGRGLRSLNGNIDELSYFNFTYMPFLADIDGDGQLEVIGGNTTYKVNIVDPDNAAVNTVSILANLNTIPDGFVSVADIDLDGQLDIVTVTTDGIKPTLTVWNGVTGEIIAGPVSPSVNGLGGSRVFIGNVDETPYPELFFSYEKKLVAYKYDPATSNKLTQNWSVNTSDLSGATTLSMFDFDQDGQVELIYRDEENLRIIDGLTGQDRLAFPCFSATHSEYPVVVDFDNDGHADILVSGAQDRNQTATDVRIYWFSSKDGDWAPARKVWNQHGYNAVHVNDDLTIPTHQLNPATVFSGKDGLMNTADDIRPFNGFLVQQTARNTNGIPFYLAPNVQITDSHKIKYDYNIDGDSLLITNLYITNVGDAVLHAPVKITTYKDDVPSATYYTFDYPNSIQAGQTDTVSFTIHDFGSWLPIESLHIRINDNGNGQNFQAVCDSCCNNNETDAFTNIPFDNLVWADSYRKCLSGGVSFFSSENLPGDNITYEWLNPDSTRLSLEASPSKDNLQLSDAGQYIFKANNINDQLNLTYTLPFLSVAPEILYWRTDAEDSNWNNTQNWSASISSSDSILAVPSTCTKVYIPGQADNFPALNKTDTDYSLYGDPTTGSIVFQYGGELLYQHKLNYDKAYIQYNWGYYNSLDNIVPNSQPLYINNPIVKKRDYWYTLAAPLKKMASGDFSLAGYPLSWQAEFYTSVPDNGELISGDFNRLYSRNDIDLSTTNNAIALKFAPYNESIGYNNHRNLENLKGIIEIPYFENPILEKHFEAHSYDPILRQSSFYYFDNQTLKILSGSVGKMKRGREAYRFIYEDDQDNVPLININGIDRPGYKQTVSIKDSESRAIMIGNPFMASINSKIFADVNAGGIDISKGYYLLSENQVWKFYDFSENNYIPVHKAFVISLKEGGDQTDLLFPLEELVTKTSQSKFGKIQNNAALSMHIHSRNSSDGDIAILRSGNNYEQDGNEIVKMILPEGKEISESFFITQNGNNLNLVQSFRDDIFEMGIGIKTADTDTEQTLEFNNIEEFMSENHVRICLYDRLLNIEQDLSRSPSYRFIQDKASLNIQSADVNRFTLRFKKEETSSVNTISESGITIRYYQYLLEVISNKNLQSVTVYNLDERLIHNQNRIGSPIYQKEIRLNSGVYIIQVVEEINGKRLSKKIVIGD